MADYSRYDKVTPPVVGGVLAGGGLAALILALTDAMANPRDAEQWWNLLQIALPILVPLVGGWIGAMKAKTDVTPTADPYNDSGERLMSKADWGRSMDQARGTVHYNPDPGQGRRRRPDETA